MAKKKNDNESLMLSEYDIDSIWMSYRYCIGRHTIAAHSRAGDIANHAYGRMTKERTLFMSKDINSEIYDKLHWNSWFEVDNHYAVPQPEFRPLDLFYRALNEFKLTIEDFREIKNIEAVRTNGEWKFYLTKYQDGRKGYRDYHDVEDLEVWQRLANFFDLNSHKWCKMRDGSIVQYYEQWVRKRTADNVLQFECIKIPTELYQNFVIQTRIHEDFIEEDNIEPSV